MTRTILNRWTNAVIWSGEAETIKDAIHAALASAATLRDADLGDADLRGATLRDADLRDADLRDANLRDADLRGATLRDADLRGATLRDADLRGATLRDADLRDADLRGATLRDADLRGANLVMFRDDLWAVLSGVPAEVPALLRAVREGRVNGSSYEGACACLVGTIANARGCSYQALPTLQPDVSRPAEQWFLQIQTGDTPATNPCSKLVETWISEWLERMQETFGPMPVEQVR